MELDDHGDQVTAAESFLRTYRHLGAAMMDVIQRAGNSGDAADQNLVADLSIGLFRIIADAANHVGEERFDAALAEEMTESFDIPLAKEMSDHGDDFRRIPAFRILQLVRDGDEANAREIALTAASRSPLAAAWFPHAASLRAIDRLLVQAPVTTVDDETLAALEKRCTDLVARIDAGF